MTQAPTDPDLPRRLRRQLMGLATWLMFLLPLAYAVLQGWMTFGWRGTALFFGIALVVNLVFYVLIASGRTRALRDPSLTFWQVLVSQVAALAMLHHAVDPNARTILLMLFVASLFFGVFALDTRRFLVLVATATGGYLGLVLWENPGVPPTDPMLRGEWLRLLSLAMILLWLALLGSYVGGLRARLQRRNEELAAAGERLRRLVSHDELTGVFNRRHLLNILGREKERSERFGHVFSVCLIDLDHFKQINDGYGHAAGDDVLKGFAARTLACARKIDWIGRVDDPGEATGAAPEGDRAAAEVDHTFGRYGGEEFLLVLPHTPLPGAQRAIERLRELVLAVPFETVAGRLGITFSAGIAEHRPQEPVAETLARADMALYRAKQAGRNRTESSS
ncbi:GGDEF domain-containing protein [Arenimonas composti]|uniref:diguanylate cyclase n=1 Tax=Arenimonas composti TR7-09 = DSM 18010 TaxID=1121013 RepID=A0A091BGE4_9GAMM|nr:GGDEF domain-containing protein [Arenimonas composti]KFN50597.1 hypothetical protein P873_05400 [Arenimonas composti TR7-09 = DSM 18010]